MKNLSRSRSSMGSWPRSGSASMALDGRMAAYCWKQHSWSWKESSKARKSWQKHKKQKAPASQCLRMMGTIWDEPNLEEDGDTVA